MVVDEARDQALQYEQEAEELREKIEKGVAKLAQSYSESKTVLSTINGTGREASAPEPADLLLGVDSMQKSSTALYQSASLPPIIKV